jgi:hypothetical protein
MNEIVQMVAQKFNLSPETAEQIVDFVVAQVKGKLPEGVSQHVDGLLSGGAEAEGLFDKGQGHVQQGVDVRAGTPALQSLATG